MPDMTPLVVELRQLLAGQIGPQPGQGVEGSQAEAGGASGRGVADLAAEDDPGRVAGDGSSSICPRAPTAS
jgi:hypothetical protein